MRSDCFEAPVDRSYMVFRTLDTDLGDALCAPPGAAKRICIATPDIFGLPENGRIGIACRHLARLLVEQGHDVVVAYVGRDAGERDVARRAEALCVEFGAAFEAIVPRQEVHTELARVPAPAWTLLEWLRVREPSFDIVHVPDWHGIGYGPLLAKSLGIAFGTTHFVVTGHAPTLWMAEGYGLSLSTERELGWVFMEQRSIELADTVICPSMHVLEWMRGAGYALPERSFAWPNAFPALRLPPAASAACTDPRGTRLEEVVFFGRPDRRDGLELFIDAVDRLVRQGRMPGSVSFLGCPSDFVEGTDLIRASRERWPLEVRTITVLGPEEALAHLSRPGRLAVIPSRLESCSAAVMDCLRARIPFVATATGGTPELVATEDEARALVAPDHVELGERIAEIARSPLRAVRPRRDFDRLHEVWSSWHAQTASFEAAAARFDERSRAARAKTPLVSVCIVHHERPELVRMAVDSVYGQDYPVLEAVLVDDGSESPPAVAMLDVLEAEFGERGWRVVRQENRYAGAARNAAAAASRGEWLLFLDDDNVLFPDAVSRLVSAARFSGADCVPAAFVCFAGAGDPLSDSVTHGAVRRFIGASRAWNRFRNVAGDTCGLVRRTAFEAVGGYPEEHRLWLQDMCFNNRMIQAGWSIVPMPDPVCFYRLSTNGAEGRDRGTEAAQVRALGPYLRGLSGEERAYASFAAACIRDRPGRGDRFRHLAEGAMGRGEWMVATELWSESRRVSPDHPSGFLQGAEALVGAGRLEEAEGVAREAVSGFPDLPGGRVQLAEVTMCRRDWPLAVERWEEVRRAFPDHPSGYLRGAESLVMAGRLDDAERVAREGELRFPELPGGWVQLAEVAMCRRDWPLAVERWEAMRRAFPDHASGYLRGAESLVMAGRLDDAERVAMEGGSRFPDLPGGRVQLAEVAMCRRDWLLAAERWKEVRRAFPGHPSGYLRGAESLVMAGRLDDAERVAMEGGSRFPDLPGGRVQLAEVAMCRRDWPLAVECWEAVRRAFPEHPSGYLRGAESLVMAGRLDDAERVAKEGRSRFPDLSGGRVQLAEVAMCRRDWPLAVECWEAVRRAFPEHPSGYLRGAESLVMAGRLDDAERVAKEGRSRFPDLSGGRVQLAEVAMCRRDWPKAVERWDAVRRAFPEHPSGYLRGAESLVMAGRLDDAERVAKEGRSRFPDLSGGRVQLAEVAMCRREWPKAAERWEAVRRAFPEHPSGYLRGSESLVRVGRLDDAEWVAREGGTRFPNLPGGRVQFAEVAMCRRDWRMAVERWEEVRRAFPEHPSGYLRGAESLVLTGRLDEAERVAREGRSRFPDLPGGRVQLAEVAMCRRNWPLAAERWEEVRRAFPSHPSGYLRGAESLVLAGRLDEAERVAREGGSRFSDLPGGRVQLAEVAMRRREWPLAVERWEEVRRAFPDHPSGYLRGAESLVLAGRLDEAERVAREGGLRFPDLPGSRVQLAEVAVHRQDWPLAIERWDGLRLAFFDHPSGYVRGAEALVRAGRLVEAEELASEAASRFPDMPGGRIQLAEVAMRRRDWNLAIERWDAFRQEFPDHPLGYSRGAEALLKVGRPDDAERLAREAVSRHPTLPGGHVQLAEVAMRRRDWVAAADRWGRLRRDFPDQRSGYVRGARALVRAGSTDEARRVESEARARFDVGCPGAGGRQRA